MRILPAGVQPRINRLVEALNTFLPPAQHITTYPFPGDQPENIAYLRGHRLRREDLSHEPPKIPYHLSREEHASPHGSLVIHAIAQVVPGITNPALSVAQRRTMAQQASFDGVPLYQQGLTSVLSRVLSHEAYQLSVDAGGYPATLNTWNAADAIAYYTAFVLHAHYRAFQHGFQQVSLTLATFFSQAGGALRLSTPVQGFAAVDGGFALQVPGALVHATALILAVPRRSLDLLAPTSPLLQDIQDLLHSVTPQPLLKLYTTYSSPWWRAASDRDPNGHFVPIEVGRTVTDLPVRQTYYWPHTTGQPATEGPAMLLASYDNGNSLGFWDSLRPQRLHAWQAAGAGTVMAPPSGSTPAPNVDPYWQRYQAPPRLVDEAGRQLALVHGLPTTPPVQHAAFRDWSEDPFGGGWHTWNIGVKSWETMEQIVYPCAPHALYICGEAYSEAQGWVEGALQTADLLLAKFGLEAL